MIVPLTYLWRVVSSKTFYSYISKWLSELILIFIYKIRVYTIEFSSMKLRDNHSWKTRLNFIFEFYAESTAICWQIGICVHTHWIRFQIFRFCYNVGDKQMNSELNWAFIPVRFFSAAEWFGRPCFLHAYCMWSVTFLGDSFFKAAKKL